MEALHLCVSGLSETQVKPDPSQIPLSAVGGGLGGGALCAASYHLHAEGAVVDGVTLDVDVHQRAGL